MTTVTESHIEVDDKQVAWIADTKVKVIEIAVDTLSHGSSPEELAFQYPHLSISQVHAALAYYYDHRDQLDAEILRRLGEVNQLASQNAESPLQGKLGSLRNGK